MAKETDERVVKIITEIKKKYPYVKENDYFSIVIFDPQQPTTSRISEGGGTLKEAVAKMLRRVEANTGYLGSIVRYRPRHEILHTTTKAPTK